MTRDPDSYDPFDFGPENDLCATCARRREDHPTAAAHEFEEHQKVDERGYALVLPDCPIVFGDDRWPPFHAPPADPNETVLQRGTRIHEAFEATVPFPPPDARAWAQMLGRNQRGTLSDKINGSHHKRARAKRKARARYTRTNYVHDEVLVEYLPGGISLSPWAQYPKQPHDDTVDALAFAVRSAFWHDVAIRRPNVIPSGFLDGVFDSDKSAVEFKPWATHVIDDEAAAARPPVGFYPDDDTPAIREVRVILDGPSPKPAPPASPPFAVRFTEYPDGRVGIATNIVLVEDDTE